MIGFILIVKIITSVVNSGRIQEMASLQWIITANVVKEQKQTKHRHLYEKVNLIIQK